MSAEQFRNTLNKIPQLKYWITGQKTGDTINQSSFLFQTRESSKKEIMNSTVDHIVPLEQLMSIVGDQNAKAIYDKVASLAPILNIEQREVKNEKGDVIQKLIVFNEIKFDSINKIVPKVIEELAEAAGINTTNVHAALDIFLSNENAPIDREHVFGWSNTLVRRTKKDIAEELKKVTTDPGLYKKQLKALDRFIDSLLDILIEYDISTSSIKGLDAEVYVKYKKTDKYWLTSWGARVGNQQSGSNVGTALGKSKNTGAKGFIKEVAQGGSSSLIEKNLKSMVEGFVSAGLAQKGSNSIVEMESSPGLKDLFIDTIVSKLSGTRKKYNREYTGNIRIGKASLIAVDNKKAKTSIAKTKIELNKAKAHIAKEIKKSEKLRNIKGQFTSPAALQAIINSRLTETIKRNMGDGSRRDILNLRTGRFAESVEVKKVTTSREGMITAFYMYMKNPYATFSAGGRQQNPRSRDPKLLVSKSIREVVSENVANKLRAVAL